MKGSLGRTGLPWIPKFARAVGNRYAAGVPAEFLESRLLRNAGFRHAFFTRRGGVSEGAYASLNFSVSVGDAAERVAKNLALAGEALGVAGERVHFLSQVHGSAAQALAGDEEQAAVHRLEGDVLLSRSPEVACGVRTADCVPILIADARSGAVAAVHAGWRGVARGAVEAGVRKLRELAGTNVELLAAIGPHIRQGAFEVSEDVASELEAASPVAGVTDRSGPKPHVSLVHIVRAKLLALGMAEAHVDDTGGCTVSEPERFFSFRRDGKVGGRHLSAIVARY
jgi:YfiH family protein